MKVCFTVDVMVVTFTEDVLLTDEVVFTDGVYFADDVIVLMTLQITQVVDKRLEEDGDGDAGGEPLPSPKMDDASSEAIGDSPRSPTNRANASVDVF
jgi:hypothetical protein